MDEDIEEILISPDRIQQRLRDIGEEINRDYADRNVLLVGVLKGAFILMADFARYLTVPVEFDFMAISSYGSATQSSGVVRILKDLDRDIADRHVVVVEDIVDSGLTLSYLLRNLRARGPASLEVMALLSKPDQIKVEVPLRYLGFEIPNVFVVGYGLDYAEAYRHLPYVGTLKPEIYGGA